MKKQRILYLDVIRIFACLLVVLMHAPIPETEGSHSLLLSCISFFTAPGVGLFFMISGALLLPLSSSVSSVSFYKHRMKKIVFPILFWTLFYWVLEKDSDALSVESVLKAIFSLPFSVQGHSVLWFLYTLVGLYLLVPLLSPWLLRATQREIRGVLLLWGITLCFPILKLWLCVNETSTGPLYYFSGYAGYFLLGYYLKNYTKNISWAVWATMFLLPIGVAFFCKENKVSVDFYQMFWYQSIWTVLMATGWFLFFQKWNIKSGKFNVERYIIHFSNCCFGIYLIHIFVMRDFIWKSKWIGSLPLKCDGGGKIIVIFCLTVIISYLCILLISIFPYAEYIVGYKSKRINTFLSRFWGKGDK